MELKVLYMSSSIVFGCWELSHVSFLMMRKKELLAKLRKIVTQSYICSKIVVKGKEI